MYHCAPFFVNVGFFGAVENAAGQDQLTLRAGTCGKSPIPSEAAIFQGETPALGRFPARAADRATRVALDIGVGHDRLRAAAHVNPAIFIRCERQLVPFQARSLVEHDDTVLVSAEFAAFQTRETPAKNTHAQTILKKTATL